MSRMTRGTPFQSIPLSSEIVTAWAELGLTKDCDAGICGEGQLHLLKKSLRWPTATAQEKTSLLSRNYTFGTNTTTTLQIPNMT